MPDALPPSGPVNGRRSAIIYLLRVFNEGEEFYKVGVIYHSIRGRYRNKAELNGYDYEVLAMHKSSNPLAVSEWEQSILATFTHLKCQP